MGSEKQPRDANPRMAEIVGVAVRMREVSDVVDPRVGTDAVAGVDAEVDGPWSGMLELVDELETLAEKEIEREEVGSRDRGPPESLYIDNLDDPPHLNTVSK
jgi:hypothetical protein